MDFLPILIGPDRILRPGLAPTRFGSSPEVVLPRVSSPLPLRGRVFQSLSRITVPCAMGRVPWPMGSDVSPARGSSARHSEEYDLKMPINTAEIRTNATVALWRSMLAAAAFAVIAALSGLVAIGGHDGCFFNLAKDQINARSVCLKTGPSTGHGVHDAVKTPVGDDSVADNTPARADEARCSTSAATSGTNTTANARNRAIAKKAASPADGTVSYLDGVAARTLSKGGDSSRPDGRKLPVGPDLFMVSDRGHETRCGESELRSTLDTFYRAKVHHFDDPRIFLGTWRLVHQDDDDAEPTFVIDLSRCVTGLLPALEAGRRNDQLAIYHPASQSTIDVLTVIRSEEVETLVRA